MKFIKILLKLLVKTITIIFLINILIYLYTIFLFCYIRLDSVVKKKYNNFFIVKTISFRTCNDLGCYYISFCNEKNIDYCNTLNKNDLNNKLLFSDKINNIYINNNTLYVVIPKNIKYNIINKNILKKISDNYYELDNKKYGVNYMIIKNE